MSSDKTGIRWEEAEGVVTLILDDPESSTNTMNDLYRRSMATVIARLEAEKAAIRGVIVTSAKKTFFAGGDLNELKQATPADAPRLWEAVREMTAQLRRLETLGVPVVAAISGSALGGGLEIALACHYRVVLDDKKIELGLPEVTLGLMPGGNGVVRMVRLVGLQKALMEVLLPGTRMRPEQAKKLGIVDALASTREELFARACEWIAANAGAKQPWDKEGYKLPGGTPSHPQLALQLPAFPATLRKQLKGANMPGPKLILAAAVEGAQTDFANAAKIETRYFVELATGRVAKNLIQAFFFDLQKINQGENRPKTVATWSPSVEIIRGRETTDDVLAQAFDFVQRIKKTPIVVNDSRGFYTSRVFGTFVNEGVSMLADGWNPASIEQAALQNGSPVGPLAVSDEVSLELARSVRLQTARDLQAEGKTFDPTPADKLVDRMVVELGRKGKAAGAGFYEYPNDGKKFLWPGLSQHFVRPERQFPSPAEFRELQERLLYITSIEAVRCLEENVVRSTAEANIGSIMGIGAPPWTGGTLQFVNYVGTREFAARASELADKYGPRFAPPKLLLAKAERNVPFE